MPEVFFNGPAGRIEARYQPAEDKTAPVALILHPHPQHGGTMNNKVTYTIYQTFLRRGFSVLRFNFRGVGRSQGVYDNGEGELADAASAMDWLQEQNPSSTQSWISGFSFGSWIAMQLLMRRPEIEGFVAVSPPAHKYDFSFLAPCPTSGLIITGNRDDIVPHESVHKLADRLMHQRDIQVDFRLIDGADHFFTQQLVELYKDLDHYLENRQSIMPSASAF